MSIAGEKKKWDYRYSYPEQIILFKDLKSAEINLIASKTGLTRQYVYMMSTGKRKLHPEVEVLVNKLAKLRQEMNSI